MDNIFLFIVGIFMIVFYANRGGDRESIEGFNDIGKMTVTDLQNLIYSTYKADVQAIKNLADTAAKLQAGGLTIPGNLTVNGNISGPTVNDLNNKITNAINTLNTNINNTKNDLINRVNNTNNRCNQLGTRIDNLFKGDLRVAGKIYANSGQIWLSPDEKRGLYIAGDDVILRNFTNEYHNSRYAKLQKDGNWCTDVWGHGWRCSHCDIRIKENIKSADSSEILDKIIELPLLNYNFIDKNYYEGRTVYGLIAQDVRKILPEAVNITTQYIPNIYKKSLINKVNDTTIILVLDYNIKLKINDKLQILVNDIILYVDIKEFTKKTITVSKWVNYNETDKVFVYGTMVDDFHELNQQYLGVLCMGGIQELTKRVNLSRNTIKFLTEKVNSNQNTIKYLTEKVNSGQEIIQQLLERLERLENLL
jgi:hypothetical protein